MARPGEHSLFVGDLSFECTDSDIINELKPRYPSLTSVHIVREADGRSKGIGFIRFSLQEEAQRCMQECQGLPFQGRTLRLSEAHAKGTGGGGGGGGAPAFGGGAPAFGGGAMGGAYGAMGGGAMGGAYGAMGGAYGAPPPYGGGGGYGAPYGYGAPPMPPRPAYAPPPEAREGGTVVFVGGLSSMCTDMDLFTAFSQVGPVSSVTIPRSGKGCGFVTFQYHAHAEASITQLAAYPICGQLPRLSWGKGGTAVAPAARPLSEIGGGNFVYPPVGAAQPPAGGAAAAGWGQPPPQPQQQSYHQQQQPPPQQQHYYQQQQSHYHHQQQPPPTSQAPRAGAAVGSDAAECQRIFAAIDDAGDPTTAYAGDLANAAWGLITATASRAARRFPLDAAMQDSAADTLMVV